MASLLARFADCLFWLARDVERANSLARVLDVNQAYSFDAKGVRNWQSMLTLYAHEEDFAERYESVTPENVLSFYVLDRSHPASIRSCIAQARENARTCRPLVSTEMWTQLNAFHAALKEIEPADLSPQTLNRIAGFVKEGCQTHVGITLETFYRDEAWHFYRLGQLIERADQTTRLLDAKFRQLLPSAAEAGSALDVSQWHALLRAAAGFQAFRREHPSRTTPESVAAFLLFNPRFPRSLLCSINDAAEALVSLRRDFGLTAGDQPVRHLRSFQGQLLDLTIADVLEKGLHEALDWVQAELIKTTSLVTRAFFGRPA